MTASQSTPQFNCFYAHSTKLTDKSDWQLLQTHLTEVAGIAKKLAAKINVAEAGELIGLLHDFGKYSANFQNYLSSSAGALNPDCDDEYVDAKAQKGKIDHSSAGAQWLWQAMSKIGKNGEGKLCAQMLALCIASHHSGLIDCLKPDGTNEFQRRMAKEDEQTHLAECQQNADTEVLATAQTLVIPVIKAIWKQYVAIMRLEQSDTIRRFHLGFWTRFLFSCLIDADRINSADFENPQQKAQRNQSVSWDVAINRLEYFLVEQHHNIEREQHALSENTLRLNEIRRDISDTCKHRAEQPQGIYSLTVPTGGGKTYASLRFALHHVKAHKLERIFYIIPYTSIIEQNAEAIRKAIEHEADENPWVLEHHSNLEPEQQTWHSKLVAENFDAPIVMTTMVQFLETLFSGGTRGVRRLHQLANSVIVFDEIQTLPINCVHLFCNALNFLTTYSKTTAVLCTATQPLLNQLKTPEKGQLDIPKENELIADVAELFKQLKRVDILNETKPEGWTQEEIANLALNEFREKGSCLVIVNTKAWAAVLYQDCVTQVNDKEGIFHLSTHQCSAHRTAIFNTIKARLKNKQPVLCFSTQLIEAGVDISFASVIRFLAGLDSIAQAAGRCNRNAELDKAEVHVINPAKETIDQLIDINEGKKQTARVFREMAGQELLAPDVMELYFKYYFYERAEQMAYPVSDKIAERNDTLLNLLSENKWNNGKNAPLDLKQAFMTAGKAFKAIDAPTHSVIVPYREGETLITELCGFSKKFEAAAFYACLKKAQKYSVNVFPNVWKKLMESDAIAEIQGEGVFYLNKCYYSDEFGLSSEVVGKQEFYNL